MYRFYISYICLTWFICIICMYHQAWFTISYVPFWYHFVCSISYLCMCCVNSRSIFFICNYHSLSILGDCVVNFLCVFAHLIFPIVIYIIALFGQHIIVIIPSLLEMFKKSEIWSDSIRKKIWKTQSAN